MSAGISLPVGQYAGHSVFLTIPTRDVTKAELFECEWIGGHLMLVEASCRSGVTFCLDSVNGSDLTLLLIVALAVTDPIRAVLLFRVVVDTLETS